MAPEQARAERVDARADIFSTGVLLWEALTGRRLRNTNLGAPRPQQLDPSIQPPFDRFSAAPSGSHLPAPSGAPPSRHSSRFVIPAVAIGVVSAAAFAYVAFLMPSAHVASNSSMAATADQTDAGAERTSANPGSPAGMVRSLASGESEAGAGYPANGTVVRTPDEDLVEIEVRVTPQDASVTIDGALITGNPFRGKFVRGDVMRRIRASAPGFVTKTHALAFNANVKIDLSLERKARSAVQVTAKPSRPSPRATESPRVEPSLPSPPPTEVNPTGGTKPRRPIDSSNPYGAE
jgi:hypothetical protein